MHRILFLAVLAGGCGDGSENQPAADADLGDGDGRPGAGTWTERAALPLRQEIGVAALDGKIYVLGGFDSATAELSEVLVYDPAIDEWSPGPPLPAPMHHANVAVAGGKLYVVGALAGLSFRPVGTTLEYTPGGDWISRTPMPPGRERGASGVAVIDDVIYVIGGSAAATVAFVDAYDPVTDRWTARPDLPLSLNHLVAGAIAGKLYAIGGRSTGVQSVVSSVYEYTPGGSWVQRSSMPTARGGCAAGVLGSEIIVVGGEGAANANGVFPQTEGYDPATDRWTTYEPMRTPRHGMGAAAVGDSLYVPGGAARQGFGLVEGQVSHEAFAIR